MTILRNLFATLLLILATATFIGAQPLNPTNCATTQSSSEALTTPQPTYKDAPVWQFVVAPGDIIVAENQLDLGTFAAININGSGTIVTLQPHTRNYFCATALYSLLSSQVNARAWTLQDFQPFFLYTLRPTSNGGYQILEAQPLDLDEATPPPVSSVNPPPHDNGGSEGEGGGGNGNGNGNGGGNNGDNGNHGEGNNGNGNGGSGDNNGGGNDGGGSQGGGNGQGNSNGNGNSAGGGNNSGGNGGNAGGNGGGHGHGH